ncbi:anaerobic glycerol-3-phosphate dehydrogenase subunit A [Desulfobaculum bizertense]|uniref:anaerobic glycerol-3-phosphate dehydrogenase subunit GlpA n=1 Tax=Desulfobaculum bizertense TaxID=376490 RepID=UPI001F2C922E|nr:anaerobic glycerol-3-phosphate dehydrogenase subunit GlpA [Desulfobaculum bizertense]UIJ36718.1 anaerobic glycerol-3-phosphate dehydrogenase subunit A [Desulfobaculum bizertense]
MQTQVLIIGGGVTGTGIARDLALRGVDCVLAEALDINAGASGGNHGLLHSGGRYACTDPEAAAECRSEGEILKRLAPHCIEKTGGIFAAVEGDDEQYAADFGSYCEKAGLPARQLDPKEAREMEPVLSDRVFAAWEVEDASVDPFRLALDNMAHAVSLGARFLRRTRVVGFEKEGGRVTAAKLVETRTGRELTIEADVIVNAAGAWAGEIAAKVGGELNMLFSKGTLLITHSRMANRVINRLRKPGDGDILVPGGTVSILGTTSVRLENLDDIRPSIEEVDRNINQMAALIPSLETTRYVRAYAGVRPLVMSRGATSDRTVSRGFTLDGHEEDGLENFITITSGKLTTYRLMAERTSDLVCERLGVSAPCLTRTEALPEASECRWTEPGVAPKIWLKGHERDDQLLCECEMVPTSAVDQIIDSFAPGKDAPRMEAVARRSRVGKGSCQGATCGLRLAGHMYDRGVFNGPEDLDSLRDFVAERWRGKRSILWGPQQNQAELQEAIHCGLFDLELNSAAVKGEEDDNAR